MTHFSTFLQFVKDWASTDDRLCHTDENPSVLLCNSFNSRIQLMQQADPERETLIMLDMNRAKSDAANFRANFYTMYFCWRTHDFADFDRLNHALDHAEELMDDFTAHLVTEYKRAKRSADMSHPLRFLQEHQTFPAETTAPFDGGWVCYEMSLDINTSVCRTPSTAHLLPKDEEPEEGEQPGEEGTQEPAGQPEDNTEDEQQD